jgi:WD40 repeat protein
MPRHLVFSPDGKWLGAPLFLGGTTAWGVWDVVTGAELCRLPYRPLASQPCFLGSETVAVPAEGVVRIWDIRTGRALVLLGDHGAQLVAVAFDRAGRLLSATAHPSLDPGRVRSRVWDVAKREEATRPVELPGFAYAAAGASHRYVLDGDPPAVRRRPVEPRTVSPDGTAAAEIDNNELRLVDPANGRQLQSLKGHEDAILCAAFSPDGRTVATGSRDKSVRLWSVTTGRLLLVLRGHSEAVVSVAFRNDGGALASCSPREVRLWPARTGDEVARPEQ